MRVKRINVNLQEELKDFPNFSATGSVKGMRDKYYGKEALLIRCGSFVYNVTSSPDIYFNLAY